MREQLATRRRIKPGGTTASITRRPGSGVGVVAATRTVTRAAPRAAVLSSCDSVRQQRPGGPLVTGSSTKSGVTSQSNAVVSARGKRSHALAAGEGSENFSSARRCVCVPLGLRSLAAADVNLAAWVSSPIGTALENETLRCCVCEEDGFHGLCSAFAWRFSTSGADSAGDAGRQAAKVPFRSKLAPSTAARPTHGQNLRTCHVKSPLLRELREQFTCWSCKINFMDPSKEVVLGFKTLRLVPPAPKRPQDTCSSGDQSAMTLKWTMDFKLPLDFPVTAPDHRIELRCVSLSDPVAGRRQKWPKTFSVNVNCGQRSAVQQAAKQQPSRVRGKYNEAAYSSIQGRTAFSAAYDATLPHLFPKGPYVVPTDSLLQPLASGKANTLQMQCSQFSNEALLCQLVVIKTIPNPPVVLFDKITSANVLPFDEGKQHALKWYRISAGSPTSKSDDEDEDVLIIDPPLTKRLSIVDAEAEGAAGRVSPSATDDPISSVDVVKGFLLPLVCIDSGVRLETAARSRHCRHVHCFDLAFFLSHHLKFGASGKNAWRCGRCGAPAHPHEIFVDQFVQSFIRQTDPSCLEVEFRPNTSEGFLDWEVKKRSECV